MFERPGPPQREYLGDPPRSIFAIAAGKTAPPPASPVHAAKRVKLGSEDKRIYEDDSVTLVDILAEMSTPVKNHVKRQLDGKRK